MHRPNIRRELASLTTASDSRDYLSHATSQARRLEGYEVIVDVDAHLQEGRFWFEIIDMLENDVLRDTAQAMMRPGTAPLSNHQAGRMFQDNAGRVPHQKGPSEDVDDPAVHGHPFAQILRRSIDALAWTIRSFFPR